MIFFPSCNVSISRFLFTKNSLRTINDILASPSVLSTCNKVKTRICAFIVLFCSVKPLHLMCYGTSKYVSLSSRNHMAICKTRNGESGNGTRNGSVKPDSGFSCSWFYRFRLFSSLAPFLVPFPDSPFLVLQIAEIMPRKGRYFYTYTNYSNIEL